MGKELLLIKLKHYIFGYNSKFQIILRVFSRKYNYSSDIITQASELFEDSISF
jgi:hypothetical protein